MSSSLAKIEHALFALQLRYQYVYLHRTPDIKRKVIALIRHDRILNG